MIYKFSMFIIACIISLICGAIVLAIYFVILQFVPYLNTGDNLIATMVSMLVGFSTAVVMIITGFESYVILTEGRY